MDGGTPNSGVELFVKENYDFTQIYDLSFESSSCLTGMPAAKLQQHLSNMNVMFNRWIAFGWCEEKGEYDEFGIVIWFSNRHSSHTIGEMSLSVLKMYRNIYDRNMSYNYHITLCRFVVSYKLYHILVWYYSIKGYFTDIHLMMRLPVKALKTQNIFHDFHSYFSLFFHW